ncbi:glycoside hydrolase family 43 protein [Belliella sp. DSM 111904]|uniref:Glycoside hydrolase family 43 protein n=1 Tax=Belliella filtrata TaxID=2923435 RepID=A0ABS9V4H3_9BACT|nr:glycoside hydrolase family 43 protein [Belliella filtrata]MCH7411305.1 glycoside hydrolase family 43 protein [Belliella filtrata]
MKNLLLRPITFAMLVLGSLACSEDEVVEEYIPTIAPIYSADPTIFQHEGIYYLYGTVDNDPNTGFEVYTSDDLVNWEGPAGENGGLALHRNNVYGDQGFWAPQVFERDGVFYMAYTANENIAIATSTSPLGPFTQENQVAIAAPVKQIDPFVFFDDDGKVYLYFVRLSDGNKMYVAEMTEDLMSIKEETVQLCIEADQPWENTESANWSVAEGPTVIKHNGKYYFVYSANDFRNPDYAVGYAVSDSPTGPWIKSTSNPILSRNTVNENGPGHGDIFSDAAGNWYYVLHTHFNSSRATPRKTAIIKAEFVSGDNGEDDLVFYPEEFRFLEK